MFSFGSKSKQHKYSKYHDYKKDHTYYMDSDDESDDLLGGDFEESVSEHVDVDVGVNHLDMDATNTNNNTTTNPILPPAQPYNCNNWPKSRNGSDSEKSSCSSDTSAQSTPPQKYAMNPTIPPIDEMDKRQTNESRDVKDDKNSKKPKFLSRFMSSIKNKTKRMSKKKDKDKKDKKDKKDNKTKKKDRKLCKREQYEISNKNDDRLEDEPSLTPLASSFSFDE